MTGSSRKLENVGGRRGGQTPEGLQPIAGALQTKA